MYWTCLKKFQFLKHSKNIFIKAIEGDKKTHYNYNKPKTGKFVTKHIGIDELRSKCKHFNEWIEKLISC